MITGRDGFCCRHNITIVMNFFHSIGKPTKRFLSYRFVMDDPKNTVASSLCDSFRKGLNWDTLSRKYNSVNLDDPIIEKVLLEFKEPIEAKRALSFFHWIVHSSKLGHGLKHYCITIHILARARLVNDARSLLESILMRDGENVVDCSMRYSVVDMLLNTYQKTNSCAFVFDLLVQAYSKLRMYGAAFDVCCYLDKHGFALSLVTFNNLLHVIQKSPNSNNLIWEVYGHMIQKRMYPNNVTVRIMTNALCKRGELQKFVDTIHRIHGKGCSPLVIVNTSLVVKMLEKGSIEEGLVLLKRMLQKNLILDTVSYSLVVYARLRSGELNSAQELYRQMLSSGFLPNSFVYTMLIKGYCEQGMVEEALNLMDEMVNLDLKPYDDTYNSLIMGCSKVGALVDTFRLWEEMSGKGLLPSTSAFNEMVGKLCQSGKMEKANEMLTILMEKGYKPDKATYLHLIDGYGREGNIQEVLKLYYEIEFRLPSPGLPIFTSIIRSLCECKKLEEADKYLAIMNRQSLDPTICIYELLISAHLENGNKGRAYHLYNEVIQKGLRLNHPITPSIFSEDLES